MNARCGAAGHTSRTRRRSASSSRTNIAGAKKVRGAKQKPVTLPDADELRKFWIGDEE